jgi:hypothetical protein
MGANRKIAVEDDFEKKGMSVGGSGSNISSSKTGAAATSGTDTGSHGNNSSTQGMSHFKVAFKPLDQLLIHNSDTAVKPIIGNKEIEKTTEPNFNSQYLSFEPWPQDEVLQKIDTTAIETHLSDVYNAMASNNTMNEKINALLYFESIIVNSNVANRLINSAFMNLLVRMMKTVKSPMLKIRVCSILG